MDYFLIFFGGFAVFLDGLLIVELFGGAFKKETFNFF
jgi:hypothetical protein